MTSPTTNHGFLPILSQHLGKTRLVAEFRNSLRLRNCLQYFQNTKTSSEVLNSIMKAALVTLDMSKASLTNSISSDLEFPNGSFSQFFLFQVQLALKQCDENEQHAQKTLRILKSIGSVQCHTKLVIEELEILNQLTRCNSLTSFIRRYSNNGLYPLLVHVDEASFLDAHYKDESSSFIYLWERTFKPTMGSYSGSSTVKTPDIYIVVSGTCSSLTKLGRGLLRTSSKMIPPTLGVHITLDMLKVEHIMEMFEETIISVNGANMKEFTLLFCNIGENYEYFCQVVAIYTAGIPRLIEYTILSLLGYVQTHKKFLDFSSKEKIDSIFANFLHGSELQHVKNAKEICPFYDNATNLANISRLRKVFDMGVMGVPIPITEEYSTEIDLIHDLNVAVEEISQEDGNQVFKMLIPKFTLIKAAEDNRLNKAPILDTSE